MLSDPKSLAIVKCHFPTSCDVSSRSVIASVIYGGEPKSVTSLVKKEKEKKVEKEKKKGSNDERLAFQITRKSNHVKYFINHIYILT